MLAVEIPEVTGISAGPRFVSQPALLEMLVAEAVAPSGLPLRARLHRARPAARRPPGRRRARRHAGGRARDRRRLRDRDATGAPRWCDGARASTGSARRNRSTSSGSSCRCRSSWLAVASRAPTSAGATSACSSPPRTDCLQIGWVIEKGGFGELRERGIDGWLSQLAQHVTPDLARPPRALPRRARAPVPAGRRLRSPRGVVGARRPAARRRRAPDVARRRAGHQHRAARCAGRGEPPGALPAGGRGARGARRRRAAGRRPSACPR